MSFRRTSQGLSNLHLFVGVDLVVFTEGGPRTISKENAILGDFEASAMDIVFWRELFRCVRSDLNVDFRALGSKNTLIEIARDVIHDEISSVCVVMDRDYDSHFSSLLKSPNVVYTRGYSWENDLYNAELIENVFFEIALVSRNTVKVKKSIHNTMKSAVSDLRWLTYADALLCIGGSALFDRKNAESAVSHGTQLPHIRREWLTAELRKKRYEIGKFRLWKRFVKLNPKRDCYGKVLFMLAYKILFCLINSHTNLPSLPKHYANVLMIKGFSDWLAAHPTSLPYRYYSGRLAKLVV